MKFTIIDSRPSIDKNTGQQYVDQYQNLSWSVMCNGDDGQTYSFLKRTKLGSPAPKVGDILDGTVSTEISKNGNSYMKFTATPKEGGYGGGFGSKSVSDPNTMLIAYAKDLVVALINNQAKVEKLTTESVMDDLDTFSVHLKGLYESLKSEKPATPPMNATPAPVQQVITARDDNEAPPIENEEIPF